MMLPSSIRTFWSLIQAPSTPRSVEVARATPCWIASSKLVSETTLSSVTLATDIGSPLSWLAYGFPEHLLPAPAENKRFGVHERRGCAEVSLEFSQKHGVIRRLLRAPRRLDGHRYHVGLRYGVRDRRRCHVPVRLEESAGFGLVVAYDPDLTRLVLGHRRHVLGHQDNPVLADEGYFGVRALFRPRALELDRPALLDLPLISCVL